jgi:hypothetical protein
MSPRSRRYPQLFETEKRRVLEALYECRKAITDSHRHLQPECPTYRLGSAVTAAIDVLAGELTGDPKHFHGRPHCAPSTKGPSEA